jgi:hypothetical protein
MLGIGEEVLPGRAVPHLYSSVLARRGIARPIRRPPHLSNCSHMILKCEEVVSMYGVPDLDSAVIAT